MTIKRYKPEQAIYDVMYSLYRKIYFEFGQPAKGAFGEILPTLIRTAEEVNAATSTRNATPAAVS